MSQTYRNFLALADIPASELRAILDEAHARKHARAGKPKGAADDDAPAIGHTLALIFEKNSTRTRFSFDMAMRQLGGTSITATSNDMQLGRGETIEDTAQVLSRYVDGIMLRANSHETLLSLAAAANVPVINGLTDHNHPCQILADLQTLEEQGRDLKDTHIAWVGDGNNVAVSFVHAASKFGFKLSLGCPEGYQVPGQEIERARAGGAAIEVYKTAEPAVKSADVVVADTWVSMGDTDYDARMSDLADFSVSAALMKAAAPDASFLHCLPAHRGEEVSASVIDGPASLVFPEAENRLHAQKAIIKWCLNV